MTKVVNQLCSTSAQVKNPCKKIQRLPKNITGYFLATSSQAFASVDAVTQASIRTEIQNKKLTVGYELSGDLDQSFENGITQTSTRDKRTAVSQRRATVNHSLNAYQQAVVSSWEGNFSRVYFFTEDDELLCEVQSDGTVKGLPLASLLVGEHPLPSGDVNSQVFFQFKKYQVSCLVPEGVDFNDIEGIYNLGLEIMSTSTTEIKFKAKACCNDLADLTVADFTLSAEDGSAQAIGGLAYANGVYTLTGTGLVSGTLASSGVLDKTEFLIEGSVNVSIPS